MGALTCNRKRGDDYVKSLFGSSPRIIDQSYDRISKKPKLLASASPTSMELDRTASKMSIASRVSQYPETKLGFTRQVHAPVTSSKFGAFSSAKKSITEENSAERRLRFDGFWLHYQNTKREAFRSLRCIWKEDEVSVKKEKEKEVILTDNEEENRHDDDDALHGSCVEEVEIVRHEQRAIGNSSESRDMAMGKEVRSLDSSVFTTDVSKEYGEAGDLGKMDLMLSDNGMNGLTLPIYKKLLDSSMRRDGKLERLKNEIAELSARRFKSLQPLKKVEQFKDNVEECFTPLTQEEENEVSHALSIFDRRKVLITHENSGFDMTGQKLQCLRPGAWLNDEVINVYLELLKERERREPKKFLNCHFFNTFFYKKLSSGIGGYSFQSVRRWTTQRKLGYSLFECDKIFVPIHKEIHWCLAIINKRERKFQYLDSLKGVDHQVLNVLSRYFVEEIKDKCGKDIDVNSWEQEFVMDLPEQENGFDCGMFMVKYADFFSRDVGLCFRQEHMPYFRKRTAKEILKLRAE